MKQELLEKARVQFITHYTRHISYLDSVRIALLGGCRWIQLRMKNAPLYEVENIGREVRKLCNKHEAVFIIDDYVELVGKIGADGVHLGLSDMPADEARVRLGDKCIIGGTANSFADVCLHSEYGVDYIGCGPYRFTETKEKLAPVLGLDGYRCIVEKMQCADINLSIVAIGGIREEDIALVLETGVNGIALSGSILKAEDPIEAMKRVMSKVITSI